MNKSRKTSHILNVFQYDETTGAVTLPSTLSLTAPSAGDNSSKVATTAWARTFVASLSYLTSGTTTTSDIGEGTNLYYTQSRFNTAFGLKTTTDLTEGINLYYTDSRVGTYLTNNSYATQSYVGTQLANLVAAAPATLDTLNELAAALGNDPSFATTVTTSIGTKVPQARTLTINGTTYDLSANRSWTITSMIYPNAGIALSTGTGWGASITDNSANWNTAYGWGNHTSAGYLPSSIAATTYVSLTGSYANPSWVTSLAYSKITGVPAFLTSYTETDPYRVTAVAVSGTSTKTITITRADASTVTTTWTDIDTDTNTYVTSAGFSGGTLTLTRNDAGTVSVSLDGRYYLATNPSGYITSSALSSYLPLTGGILSGTLSLNSYSFSGDFGAGKSIYFAVGYTSTRGINFGWDTTNDRGFIGSVYNGQAWKSLDLQPIGGSVLINGNTAWHSGNLTNLNQLTNGPGYLTGITSSQVTTALGFTPYNSTNPNGYITGISSANVTTALGFTPYNSTNPSGYITGITSSNVTTALGYTPLSNSGNVTIGGYLTVNGAGTSSSIYMNDSDEGQREIHCNSNRIGFLTQAGSWGAWCDDSGNWNAANFSGSSSGTNTGDQTNISGNAVTAGGLAVHSGRNNEANKIVRTDGNGYIQAGYINSTSGNENNNSNADRVWGTNGSDDYLRTYRTSALSVGYAASAGAANGSSFFTQANATWGARMQLGGNGDPGAVATTAVVQATDGNLHMDCGTGKSMYLNYYRNGTIYLNGGTYSISSNGSYYNGTASYANNSGALNGWGYTSYAYRASGSGYYQISDWIQVNTNTGLYWPNHYGLHFYPNNDGSYGSAQILGEKGGWRGLHFGGGTGITLMMNEGEFGFHRQAVGWVARFTSGRFYGACDNVYNLDYAIGNAHYWTGMQYFQTNNGGQAVNNSNSAKLEAYSTGNNSAFMSFHRGGYYAVNFGLDDDNVMRIGGWSASANRWQLDMSGNMTVAGDVTAYSDARVKENIITVDNALTKVLSLRGVYYNRIDSDDKKTKIGVIAQETLLVVPEVVNQDNDGMFNVSYGNLAGLFIEAIKEQQKEIEELKTIIYGLTR